MKQVIKYGIVLSSLVCMTACQPKATAEKQEKVATTAQIESQNTASYFVTTQVLAEMLQETMALILHLGNQQAAAQKLKPIATNDQIQCFVTSHQEKILEQLQKYLTAQFTEQELNQLNQYFASSAGKKQMTIATQAIVAAIQKVEPKAEDMPTPEEQKQIEQFVSSPLGMKLQQVLQNKTEIDKHMQVVLEEKLKTCKIDVTPLDKPAKATSEKTS